MKSSSVGGVDPTSTFNNTNASSAAAGNILTPEEKKDIYDKHIAKE